MNFIVFSRPHGAKVRITLVGGTFLYRQRAPYSLSSLTVASVS
jgi:hypothetical protein